MATNAVKIVLLITSIVKNILNKDIDFLTNSSLCSAKMTFGCQDFRHFSTLPRQNDTQNRLARDLINGKRNRRAKQGQRLLADYVLQEGGKACAAGLKRKTENFFVLWH
jgi:hypothetical protein